METLSLSSPCGPLTLFAEGGQLQRLCFGTAPSASAGTPLLREAALQLDAYFAGRLRTFDLPLAPAETPFARDIRAALLCIPCGETRSYAALAAAAGHPGACRAAGTACGKNPLPIIVPCHRVVRSDGTGGSYSGGQHRKQLLLRLETRYA